MTDPRLRPAVDRLYEVFARYPLPAKVEGCPCCVDAADEARLHVGALNRIPALDLRRYAFKALTTWGTVDDLKHFLPRLLELVADHILGVDAPIVTGKLAMADWRSWPDQERDAVRVFLEAWWRIERAADPWVAADCLAAIACAGVPVEPFLHEWWEAEDGHDAILRFLGHVSSYVLSGQGPDAFWRDPDGELEAWFARPEHIEPLLAAWAERPSDGYEHTLAALLEAWAISPASQ